MKIHPFGILYRVRQTHPNNSNILATVVAEKLLYEPIQPRKQRKYHSLADLLSGSLLAYLSLGVSSVIVRKFRFAILVHIHVTL